MPSINKTQKIHILIIIIMITSNLYSQNKKVIGYYPYWEKSDVPVEKIDFQNLTHIKHAFAYPDTNGNLIVPQDFLYPELLSKAHMEGVKVLVSLGGWNNSDAFAPMIIDQVKRNSFINQLKTFVNNKGYDGIDIDWEYPKDEGEGQLLTTFISDLRNKFGNSFLITIAANSGDYIGKYCEYEKLEQDVDWFAIMAFDYHGNWIKHSGHNAPLYQSQNDIDGSVNQSVKYFHENRKIQANKLLLAIPFYGKKYKSKEIYASYSGSTKELKYREIEPLLNQGWTYNWDEEAKVPYLRNKDFTEIITYDDTNSIHHKSEYIKANNLAGAMIWALGQDLIDNKALLLKKTADELLFAPPTKVENEEEINIETIKLYNNYPNPFNPTTVIKFYNNKTQFVKLTIYDSLGRKISTIYRGVLPKGTYIKEFNAEELSSGNYFYVLSTNENKITKKMNLLK